SDPGRDRCNQSSQSCFSPVCLRFISGIRSGAAEPAFASRLQNPNQIAAKGSPRKSLGCTAGGMTHLGQTIAMFISPDQNRAERLYAGRRHSPAVLSVLDHVPRSAASRGQDGSAAGQGLQGHKRKVIAQGGNANQIGTAKLVTH